MQATFLFTVVGATRFLAVLVGQFPGDWGFFIPYLTRSISLVVLAINNISPGYFSSDITNAFIGVLVFLP
ncbi:hypothetical protein ACQJBY_032827 [Aegilops geniculata]